jgi:ribosomal protein S27E
MADQKPVKCPNCGAEVDATDVKCAHCGQSLVGG